jgi:hypothetical protein
MLSYRRPRENSVMFAAHFDDGRTSYFVIQGHGPASEDFRVLSIARERQDAGELPPGEIVSIKRVR